MAFGLPRIVGTDVRGFLTFGNLLHERKVPDRITRPGTVKEEWGMVRMNPRPKGGLPSRLAFHQELWVVMRHDHEVILADAPIQVLINLASEALDVS